MGRTRDRGQRVSINKVDQGVAGFFPLGKTQYIVVGRECTLICCIFMKLGKDSAFNGMHCFTGIFQEEGGPQQGFWA